MHDGPYVIPQIVLYCTSLRVLTLFVGDSVARIVSLPRAAHFGVAGIGSSGELMMMDRYPYRSWVDIEEEWLAGHMTLFDTETGALDTVASYDHLPRQRSGPTRPIIGRGECGGV